MTGASDPGGAPDRGRRMAPVGGRLAGARAARGRLRGSSTASCCGSDTATTPSCSARRPSGPALPAGTTSSGWKASSVRARRRRRPSRRRRPRPTSCLPRRCAIPGMPADRYWQLEEGSVDVSAIEAQPHDLARLCLAEFALVSGDDWLVIPVDGKLGARQPGRLGRGDDDVRRDDRDRRGGHGPAQREASGCTRSRRRRAVAPRASSCPRSRASPLLGDPIEEIAFLRDETANMGWAVERVVPGRSGDPRQRSAEPPPVRPHRHPRISPRTT